VAERLEVCLCAGPVLGQIGLRVDLERTAIRLHRLVEQGTDFVSVSPLSLIHERNPEIVLCRRCLLAIPSAPYSRTSDWKSLAD
jgi:hypothetical protein